MAKVDWDRVLMDWDGVMVGLRHWDRMLLLVLLVLLVMLLLLLTCFLRFLEVVLVLVLLVLRVQHWLVGYAGARFGHRWVAGDWRYGGARHGLRGAGATAVTPRTPTGSPIG